MKIPDLSKLMISLTNVKKELSKIINNNLTKVIVKNNAPVSVIMPYPDYLELNKKDNMVQNNLRAIGEDITLQNGVQMKVCVDSPVNQPDTNEVVIKTYIKVNNPRT